ncbi:hypothetical protein Desde_2016 [Desulfitobacterium dehalogenans ATCC 51507]|uniref:DUF456 domain-containing protein n=1 Tax=Desulfitobacterium dehalogenans (strain ATCC 51507 / DSM 9161 / JW/IU-DC1) TaxID=756499 RepID=I4A8W7_DESDJ|nr:DUF456 domain-containing protein [Desulfitobacterium dehalogenans]AFM00402.1 hypothetical protein Desde_2016 [Desulfitobacterium dehalogenans ATCC 51507]
MTTVALIIAILLFILGLLGTVLPILPGAILIYGGMLIYGLMTGFATLDFSFYFIQGLVFAFIFLVDYLATAAGTRRFGGSKQAGWGAAAGMIVGLFFGPLGILVGPFLGAVGAELLRKTEFNQAIRVGFGTLVGLLGGTIIKLGVEILMIIYFFIKI